MTLNLFNMRISNLVPKGILLNMYYFIKYKYYEIYFL